MFLIALAFICALAISSVAIYYSVIGLAAIFAAAKVPIYIMGGVLEVAKLVTSAPLTYTGESNTNGVATDPSADRLTSSGLNTTSPNGKIFCLADIFKH